MYFIIKLTIVKSFYLGAWNTTSVKPNNETAPTTNAFAIPPKGQIDQKGSTDGTMSSNGRYN